MNQTDLEGVTTVDALISVILSLSVIEHDFDKIEIKRAEAPDETCVFLEHRQSSSQAITVDLPFAYSAEIQERLRRTFDVVQGWAVRENDKRGQEVLRIFIDNSHEHSPVGIPTHARSGPRPTSLPGSFVHDGPSSPVTKKSL